MELFKTPPDAAPHHTGEGEGEPAGGVGGARLILRISEDFEDF